MNLRGVEYGLVAKEEHPEVVEFPLTGKVAVFFDRRGQTKTRSTATTS